MRSDGISRDLNAARLAYSTGDPNASRSAHERRPSASVQQPLLASGVAVGLDFSSASSIAGENHKAFTDWFQKPAIKSFVSAIFDGASWLLILIAIAAGASLSSTIALRIAVALTVSGALHCGLTEFFNVKSMHDFATSEKRREQWEFDNYPEGEVQEMIELYMSMGFAHHDAANVINIMAKHPSFFVNHMMVEELGMLPPDPHTRPAHDGLIRVAGFCLAGSVVTSVLYFSQHATYCNIATACSALFMMILVGFVQGRLLNVEGWFEFICSAVCPIVQASVIAVAAYVTAYWSV